MTVPDYSVWLDRAGQLQKEELGWRDNQEKTVYAGYLKRLIVGIENPLILELGCGTGWVPTLLTGIQYVGVDGNAGCVELARKKTAHLFYHTDLRVFPLTPSDVVCAFAVLKHFALVEWDAVVGKILQHAPVAVFTMRIDKDTDDFRFGFPHTTVSRAHIDAAVKKAGHVVVSVEPSAIPGVDTAVFTRRA